MFITFEGIEGSGKSTAIHSLAEWLQDKGFDVTLTREPGASSLGRELRCALLNTANSNMVTEAELFLYLADRAQHVSEVLRPALAAGRVVLCDRYADSTVVYQGYGRQFDLDKLFLLNEVAVQGLWPDLTLLFDLEVEVGLKRARARNKLENKEDAEGRFEAESLAFHRRIKAGYYELAAKYKERYRLIDASLSPEAVFEQAKQQVALALKID